ncbi:MAG: hypothetical protein ACRC4M_00340 [Mycoplasma sp.]
MKSKNIIVKSANELLADLMINAVILKNKNTHKENMESRVNYNIHIEKINDTKILINNVTEKIYQSLNKEAIEHINSARIELYQIQEGLLEKDIAFAIYSAHAHIHVALSLIKKGE